MTSRKKSKTLENNFNQTTMTTTSICIPRVFQNITSNQITQVFEGLGLGKIQRIDLVPFANSKGEHLNRAFVYIQWNDSEAAKNLILRKPQRLFIKIHGFGCFCQTKIPCQVAKWPWNGEWNLWKINSLI